MKPRIRRLDGVVIDGPEESTTAKTSLADIPAPVITSPKAGDVLFAGTIPFTGTGVVGLETLISHHEEQDVWRSMGFTNASGMWSGSLPFNLNSSLTVRVRHLDNKEWGAISEPVTYRIVLPPPVRESPPDGSAIHLGHLIKGTAEWGAEVQIEVFNKRTPTIVHRATTAIDGPYGFQVRPDFPLTDNGEVHVLRIRQERNGLYSDWTTSEHIFIL
ncbi:hypothetical protein NTD84_16195 [Pseudomonas sp. 14P_8.1_Bac3]|uniref:hypothetical protein n=1 Tax=Pseudomonas sp. 14P_8.1_Bac3 TaxID=2971621 RepID=UPI0021C6B72B|nr:hypothetical protein [Pseudomonas sp. 14P_8.1_Bac3]MCU1761245.1 hypothetical protein [Pseudomonas sp. 14P_8.1_Bac3]